MSEREVRPEPRLDPPPGGAWSTTHTGEWPEGFGPGHPDYDDGDGEW